MDELSILQELRHNAQELADNSPLGQLLWKNALKVHPADLSSFFEDLDDHLFNAIFPKFPRELKLEIFEHFSDAAKIRALAVMSEQDKIEALNRLPSDELTDLFDSFSDEELKANLHLLHRKSRENLLSLMKFSPESAGGIMNTDVITLVEDFTVEKSIHLLQRLRPRKDIYQQIYVTDRSQRLIGHINLEDLVLEAPQSRIGSFMHSNELVASTDQDREQIAQEMRHYGLMSVPVVSEQNHFLGIISSETLVDVLVEEASEDVQKMSALAPMKQGYFDIPFYRLFYERSYILIGLLLAQSFTTTIMRSYEATLRLGSLLFFTNMLISTGGNTSNQTSALVIQGLATGDLRSANVRRFIKREMLMGVALSCVLGVAAFARAYFFTRAFTESITISLALSAIVVIAVTLGSSIPLLLRRFNIDPAFSAGPFLATLMDILGVLIYCAICRLIFGA
ncbi:magnesium transporter [Vermiphilus pyriformis]|nr:MAG: magnesium transporter [Vermiphilus pyriformis]